LLALLAMLAHVITVARGFFPDVVWVMLAYVFLLDLFRTVIHVRAAWPKGGRAALAALLSPQFWVAIAAEDVTAKHAAQLALSGFVAGLYLGQSWQAAAFGAIAGAAIASVADEREEFLTELAKAFGRTPAPAPKPAIVKKA
jgi:hypothetical protein